MLQFGPSVCGPIEPAQRLDSVRATIRHNAMRAEHVVRIGAKTRAADEPRSVWP